MSADSVDSGGIVWDFDSTGLGRTWNIGPVAITKEKILSFAREYDPLPFHTDEEYAKSTRFKGLIAPGVMSFMALWSQFIKQDLWGENMLGGKSTKIEWLRPVHAGDILRGELVVSGKRRRNPHNGVVEISCRFFNQDDVLVMTDITEMVVAG